MNSFRNNRLSDLERACPGVGREWIRTLLAELKKSGDVACRGRGPESGFTQPDDISPERLAFLQE